jgi:aminopeptidase YwaD
MTLKKRLIAAAAVALIIPAFAAAQMTPWFQWTFLPQNQMDWIVGESSGETALRHILAMGGMPRNLESSEYSGTFLEAGYVLAALKSYGLADAAILRYPGGETWDGVRGEIWETSPGLRKLASYADLTAMLATGSNSADVTAELVWVGEGTAADIEKLDLKGKIVVTSGSVSAVHAIACQAKGAEGVVAFAPAEPPFNPLSIPWNGIRETPGKPAKFAFWMPLRDGLLLAARLRRGEKITVRALVEAKKEKYEIQDVAATIPGTDPNADEIILTAHLFEGFAKQGANDNLSGSAAILEAARTLQTLIEDGRLPRPKRTIRFLWIPEISGSIAFVKDHRELMRRTLCNINLDMVGLLLSRSQALFTLMRTSYGNPHYINDVMENYYRYVGETSRSYVTAAAPAERITAPSGSDEPMHYYMGTHFGASDHEIFNNWGLGVPGVVMNTWPDSWYHTSQDTPDKIDPTQLKRAAVITAAAAYTIASADDRIAGQIAAEIVSNASGRIGHQLARGTEEMKRADAAGFAAAYAKARAYVESAAINERATLDSVRRLVSNTKAFDASLAGLKTAVSGIEQSSLKTLESAMRFEAALQGMKPVVLKLSDLEKKAAAIIPKPTATVKEGGYMGYEAPLNQALGRAGQAAPDRSFMRVAVELQLLCDGKNSALDIKKMLDTQNRQVTPLDGIINYLGILKDAGLVAY